MLHKPFYTLDPNASYFTMEVVASGVLTSKELLLPQDSYRLIKYINELFI